MATEPVEDHVEVWGDLEALCARITSGEEAQCYFMRISEWVDGMAERQAREGGRSYAQD